MKELIFLLLLSTSLYTVKEPYKSRTKELCSRSNVITQMEPKEGKIFDKPMSVYKTPKYRYETGFPITNNDYRIIRL